ncbi:MAG: IMP cyclohydrolase [Deltaproteobacteria bacterium]|nr:IMP cyclohydrolase [Deltaproteobacteria bacterium]
MKPITRALISVTDKSGIVEFGKFLAEHQVEILSTGGTAKALREGGVKVIEVSDFTGFPEMLDGRVKTLHPKIHGGILGRRDLASHQEQMARHGIKPIDLVVVNLYQFEQVVAKPGCSLEDAIENIDIGGPAMLRSSAKNYQDVAVVTDPADYPHIMHEMKLGKGALNLATRFALAKKVFKLTHEYDGAIYRYLTDKAPAC